MGDELENKEIIEYYKLLIQARNFHYENFNKWMVYYYVAIGALSVAFFNHSYEMNKYEIIIIILGFCVSLLWYFSCKGYYYWIYNWTDLLKKFENEQLIGYKESMKIYSVFSETVYNQKPSFLYITHPLNISTTKTTMIFAFIITMSWGYLLLDYSCTELHFACFADIFSKIGMLCVVYLLIVCLSFVGGKCMCSKLDEHTLVNCSKFKQS